MYCELKQWCVQDIVVRYMQLYESNVFKKMNHELNSCE
jgi:hypothetical protein